VTFLYEWLQFRGSNYFAINQHLKPKHRFVGHFHDDADFRNPLCPRARSACRPIVCRNGCAASEQLLAQNLRVRS